MFGNVMGFDINYFEKELQKIKHKNGYKFDTQLTINDLKELIIKYENVYKSLHPQQ